MRGSGIIGVAAAACLVFATARAEETALAGFSAPAARDERAWEAKLRALPDPEVMRAAMKRLSARPHAVGQPYDRDNAEWILAQFKAWGLDAHIETFEVLFPTPKERRLEMLAPTRFVAGLRETPVAADPSSRDAREQLPPYNAYSADGDVTAPLVYVNYGTPEDYEVLDRLGISVKGAVVIARYGRSWRGVKPKVAAEHGAAACVIYSDPRDDGYFRGPTFPDGPFRPSTGVQRGSVMDTEYVGDPLTPGVGATKDAPRLARNDVTVITRIPVLPISYADAGPLLAALGGPMAPEGWRGALPFPYHVGPGAVKVRLALAFNWDMKTVYDVVARIPGAAAPDEWVIRGNHHDAWVHGAEDPISGLVALLEEARACSELLKQGWRPRRTILFCAWDGEEPGLLGSTEWAETHAAELSQHAVAYLNSDSNSRGYLDLGGSHTFEAFYNEVARDITDPESGTSVWRRLRLRRIESAATADERKEIRERADLRVGALGFGSDYTVFLDRLGIPCLSLGFGGEDPGGVYHTIYDDFYWYTHFGDTTFSYGRALAQTAGTAVLRLADAEVLPVRFANLADTVNLYVAELRRLLDKARDDARERNREIEEGVFAATADPRAPLLPPSAAPVPPHLDFAPLENAADALARSAERCDRALAQASAAGLANERLAAVNGALVAVERAMLDPEGLPGRPWFRNVLYAPGTYSGYGVKTMPMVREPMELARWPQADEGSARTAKTLAGVAAAIDRATAALEAAVR